MNESASNLNNDQVEEGKGASHAIEQRLLQTLVPVNSLTVDHLNTLLRDRSIEMVCAGQSLFKIGEYDNQHVYLLSGKVMITDLQGQELLVRADDPVSRYPLKHHQPRRHEAMAATDCSIVRFDSDQLDAMLAWDQASNYILLDITSQRDLDEDADWMLTLLKSNLFYKVPPMNIREILNKFKPVVYSTGDTVLRQGEVGDCCYFIKEGVAGVYQSTDEKSAPELVAELGVGRCFGEDALVNETVRNATIEMHSNGVLMKLDKNDFFLLLKSPSVNTMDLRQALQLETQGSSWIDVRTQEEYEKGHYPGSLNMPLNLLKLKSRMLNPSKHYIIYCNSGRRSLSAGHFLSEEGFNVSVLAGGFTTYSIDQQKQFETSSV